MPPVFDAHFHIVDPAFPLRPSSGYRPPSFTVSDYRNRTAHLGVVGGVVVAASFQDDDSAYLLNALARLGEGFVGVAELRADVPDRKVLELAEFGVRGVRFNLRRHGPTAPEHLETLARRVFDLAGWHAELYVDTVDLPDLAPTVARLPAVSIDHLGLSAAGLPHLLRLVEKGTRVKASGFGRGDLDIAQAVRAIVDVDPRALMFGTDLPSTRAARSFRDSDVALLAQAVGPDLAPSVLEGNARRFYRLEKAQVEKARAGGGGQQSEP